MAVDDLWYLKKRDADGKRLPSKRHGRGQRWRVRVEGLPTEAFDNKAAAEDRETELRNAKLTGTALNKLRSEMSVRDYGVKWRADQPFGLTTQSIVDQIFRLYVDPNLGDTPMAALAEVSKLQPWITELNQYLSAQTIVNVWQHFSAMLRYAVDDKAVSRIPKVKLPIRDRSIKNVPTSQDVQRLVKSTEEPFKASILLGSGCGLRGGEIFGLEPDCFSQGLVEIRQQIRKIGSAPAYLGPPKTKASFRTVDVPDFVDEAVQQLQPTKHVLWDRTDPRKPRQRDVWLLFESTRAHMPITGGSWDNLIKRAAQLAGLEPVKFHLLRHYFATHLILQGANVKRVQRLLGHARPTTTLDTYVGWWPDLEQDTAAVMDAALRF